MNINVKNETKIWSVYFITILVSVYIHEIGHCIPAWINGFAAIPTPAKEYILGDVPDNIQRYVSLGGITGTVLFSFLGIVLFLKKSSKYSSAILVGAIATPGFYTLRFFIAGRGHDLTEFQEAQAAIGLEYSGHSLDWFFLILFVFGTIIWIIETRPGFKIIGRLLIGFLLTFVFVIGLQVINNAIFDPIFQ
jgi:hypothetical protein